MVAVDLVPALLSACPKAKARWDEHLEQWRGEPRGHFNDMAVFAHHIVESYFEHDDRREMRPFFDLLNHMLLYGDAQVRELATIGLIEDIQNIASGRPGRWQVFEPWLHPATRQAWQQIEEMWRGVGSLADMVRRERGTAPPRDAGSDFYTAGPRPLSG